MEAVTQPFVVSAVGAAVEVGAVVEVSVVGVAVAVGCDSVGAGAVVAAVPVADAVGTSAVEEFVSVISDPSQRCWSWPSCGTRSHRETGPRRNE